MEQERINEYLRGISEVAGIPFSRLEEYAKSNSLFNILEHPRLLDLTDTQYQKIEQLNAFLRAFNTLKVERDMPNRFGNSERAGNWFRSMIGNMKDHERMMVAFVDNQMRLISVRVLAEGTVNEAPVYPRQFLRHALEVGATGVFLCHNHPGGSERPSGPDLDVTTRMQKALEPMGIMLHDHFIVTERKYTSLREEGIISSAIPDETHTLQTPVNPDVTGSLQRCITGMANLIGVPEGKLINHAKEHGPFFILQAPESIPLTPKQHHRMSLVSEFQKIWQDAVENRPLEHTLGTSSRAGDFVVQKVGMKPDPAFLAVYLNSQNQVIEASSIQWKSGEIDPKIIVSRAVASDCNSIILARNTDEIRPMVMDDDRRLAFRISNAMQPMSIPLVDYIIANYTGYVSLAESGLLSTKAYDKPSLEMFSLMVNEPSSVMLQGDMEMER